MEIQNNFKIGGPLTDIDSSVYIIRDADYEVVKHLQSMEYVLIIEPRQQGKTSLVNRLIYSSALGNTTIVYIDVSSCDHSNETGWYKSLCKRILDQLEISADEQSKINFPQNSVEWRDFLHQVATRAHDLKKKLVIILDEIGSAKFENVTGFYVVLRDIYNSRQAEAIFQSITFMLVGAFHPSNLIDDDSISPFNVAQQVRLQDFTSDQIATFLSAIADSENVANLANRVYFWTNGQPYLTQLLCSFIDSKSTPDDVDNKVHVLFKSDKKHLPPLLKKLSADTKLIEYVDRLFSGEKIKFYPTANPRQADLELLGFISDDMEGNCCIKNRIYQLGLKTFIDEKNFDVFLCHNTMDKAAVKIIGEQLKSNGILPWLDEWELPPGLPWQRLLEQQIESIHSAAVFVGKEGIGPWQGLEIEAFLREFVKRGCRVIPVLLTSAPAKPDLPVFLAGMGWVDFRQKDPDPLKRLIWGITGKNPE
jgi:hypothetical protein